MPAPRPRILTPLAAALAGLWLAGAAGAQPAAPSATVPEADAFRLHQAFKSCGKKWLKRAARLAPEQLEWMMRREHRRYTLSVAGHTVMTLELLSTPSFRDCDVARQWSARETTLRVTYHAADGSRPTRLVHYANDDVFFDGEPSFHAAIGRALLRGVRSDGTRVSRWLELDRLPAMVAERRLPEGVQLAELAAGEPAGAEVPATVAGSGAGGL